MAKEGDLAVLHNRNKMVNAFATTEWIAGSGGAVISRSVTSCAGMTAYLVLLAQTRVGFLRGKRFHQLTPQEQAAQREEAFARATVALTRAQQICLIMGPLDMRGLVGAATIMGCLKYGACFSELDDQDVTFPTKDEDLLEAPDDSAFLQSWKADRVLRLLSDIQVDRCADECWNRCLTYKGSDEQPHAKLWAFPPAMLQRIPILNSCMRIVFAYHLKVHTS